MIFGLLVVGFHHQKYEDNIWLPNFLLLLPDEGSEASDSGGGFLGAAGGSYDVNNDDNDETTLQTLAFKCIGAAHERDGQEFLRHAA